MKLKIVDLLNTPLSEIVNCIIISFKNYSEEMPTDIEFYKRKFDINRVNYEYSYGIFVKDELVAFVINGIDESNGRLTAFNLGTGVVPSYRGLRLIDKIYDTSIPILKSNQISTCLLEVIKENEKAIHVYKRIGFKIGRTIQYFEGYCSSKNIISKVVEITFEASWVKFHTNENLNRWENQYEGILRSKLFSKTYLVCDLNNNEIGYFTINDQNKRVIRFVSTQIHTMLNAIAQITEKIKISCYKENDIELISYLKSNNFELVDEDYEMKLEL